MGGLSLSSIPSSKPLWHCMPAPALATRAVFEQLFLRADKSGIAVLTRHSQCTAEVHIDNLGRLPGGVCKGRLRGSFVKIL